MSKNNVTNFPTLKPVDQARVMDSLVNFASGMGVYGRDKRKSSVFVSSGRMGYDELEALFREDWIGGKIIEIIPEDMTRNWRSFSDSALTPEQITLIQEEEKRLKIKTRITECKKWARLYGGCLAVLNVDDGKKADEPLELDNIKKGGFKNIIVFDRAHSTPHKINFTRPFDDNFREPETYRLSNTAGEIHHTRVVRMNGITLPYRLFQRNNYWGDSILQRIRDALVNVNTAVDSTAGLLYESNVDVIGVKGLISMLATDEGTKSLLNRFSTAKYLKSNNNISIIDKENEEMQKFFASFSGLPDVLEKFLMIVSATSDIPATRLFGRSPMGMNATGDSDLVNYYDSLGSKQELELRPPLEYIDTIMAVSAGIDPDKMKFEFDPLWQVSDVERADIRLKNAQADQIYLDMGIVRESMIAREAKAREIFTTITDDHIAKLEELEKEADKMAIEERNLMGNEEENEGDLEGNEGEGNLEGNEEENENDPDSDISKTEKPPLK